MFSRRLWLSRITQSAALVLYPRFRRVDLSVSSGIHRAAIPAWRKIPSAMTVPSGPMQELVLNAVDAAKSAGAQYADARITRVVQHHYECIQEDFEQDIELVGIGVRALVNGYWGFAASPFQTDDEVAQLAHNAVIQARSNATGPARAVDFEAIPTVKGTWATPVAIDPFSVTIEEKRDYIDYWRSLAAQHGVPLYQNGLHSVLDFVRQERVLATSDGSLVAQTVYESSGHITCATGRSTTKEIEGLGVVGKGWELFLDADLPAQFLAMEESGRHRQPTVTTRTAMVGRYTLVCDGATMAALVDQTMGIGTQLDRALGYEANAGGTSFIDDPLGMIGTFQVASPLVTVTANRSGPGQLATVKWDDEAVASQDFTLVKNGVLTDFQTTREQAGWLAPYYQREGRSVQSNGCAAAETALSITMQHMPNLMLAPNAVSVSLNDLIADVSDGVLITKGRAECDWQARGGVLYGTMRQIKNGRLGAELNNGAILFDTLDLWKKVKALGGSATMGGVDVTQYTRIGREEKGQPAQATSHSIRAAAATIVDQPMIDPTRKA